MDHDPRQRFGAAVRARRRVLAWSQEELADRATLDRTYVSGIERGIRNPSLLTQQRLADALGVTLEQLYAMPVEGGG